MTIQTVFSHLLKDSYIPFRYIAGKNEEKIYNSS